METVLLSGGTGLVGTHLSQQLMQKGFRVALLSRSRKPHGGLQSYQWDPEKGDIDEEALTTADHIIHLAGANILEKRWTKERKQLIIDSRVKTSDLLFKKVMQFNAKPKTFVSASAIGYYGVVTSEHIFTETDPPAAGFLGETCRLWEHAADQFENEGIRTVKVRTAPVLAKEGGAIKAMLLPVKMGIASPIGSGKQYLPWIHIDDLCGIYIKAIEDQRMTGAYNAAAPDHRTNKEFLATLAQTLHKPFWFPNIPAALIKILLGEVGDATLKGSRVSAEKILAAGYTFQFPTLENALQDLLITRKK